MSFFGGFGKKSQSDSQNGKWKVGDRIAEDYEIRQVLGGEGKSGMGVVYICYYAGHQRIYALKTIQEKFLFSEENQKLFEREAIIWTELEKHPYIVQARYVVKLEHRLFIALEYIAPDQSGKNTLTHYIGKLTLPEILKFSIQFCYGMEYAYSKGIDAHRDIKPDNIMINLDKTVKITDFGLVKVLQEIQLKEDIISNEENLSLSIFRSKGKNICGTLPYMAPEQFDGYADKRSDIYAFGVVLYQTATGGRLPFVGRTQEEYERLHRHERITQLSSPLFPIIQKCLEKNPDKRYQDFEAIREELLNLFEARTGETITPPEMIETGGEELVFRGFALNQLERYAEAFSCYDRALELDPDYPGLRYCKGDTLNNLGRWAEAVSCYNAEIEMHTQYAFFAESGKIVSLIQLGMYQEAMNCFDSTNPEIRTLRFPDKLACYAYILLGINRYHVALQCQVALKCINESITLDPRNSEGFEQALNRIRSNQNLSQQAVELKQLVLQRLGR